LEAVSHPSRDLWGESQDDQKFKLYFGLLFSTTKAGDDVMSPSGNHALAIVEGSESYDTLKEAFGEVFSEINDTIKTRTHYGK